MDQSGSRSVLAALLSTVIVAPAMAQGLPPARLDATMAGARSCAAVTGPADVDADRLKADGRGAATLSGDGKGGRIFIAADHRVVDLASTGSTERPAVRVAVGPVIQETK